MATITSAGVGSGLDIESLITKLMAAESLPLQKLQTKHTEYESQISAYGKLSSVLDTFRSSLSPLNASTDFKVYSATSSDETVATATTSISASAGQYSLDVVRLAENHKKRATVGYANSNVAKVGVANDMITVNVGATNFSVEFGNKTLDQIAQAINSASDNGGVTASVVKGNGATPYSLVLTANSSGSTSFLQTSFSIDPFKLADQSGGGNTNLAAAKYYADSGTTKIGRAGDVMTINGTGIAIGDMTLTEVKDAINLQTGVTGVTANVESSASGYKLVLTSGSAITTSYTPSATLSNYFTFADQNVDRATTAGGVGDGVFDQNDLDAILSVDGVSATRTSNSVTDVVTGLSFALKKAGSTTITVTRDTGSISNSVAAFVKAYNTMADSLDTLNQKDLKNDTALRSASSQIRNAVNTAASGLTYKYLTEIGVSFVLKNQTKSDGTIVKVSRLELDSSKLSTALSTNFSDVAALFSDSTQGFAVRLDSLANNFVKASGFIETRTDGVGAMIKRNESQQTNMNTRLALIEQRYRAQFTAMDTLVAQMKSTSSFLTQQLGTSTTGGG